MISYTNPLFSIIVFLMIIAVTIVITNFLGSLKEKNRIKYLKKFVDKFEFLNDKEIKAIVKDEVSINALLLLAMAFEKEGNYEKSLNIYLAVLNNIDKNEKFDVLQKVAKVYFKAGFLHKSREALLEILRTKPRNQKALKLLLVVDDKLKNYDEMENIIEIFEELEVDVSKEKGYVMFQKAMFEMNKEKLKEIYKEYPYLKRSYIRYMINLNPKEVFEEIEEDDVYEMLDIFYNYDNLPAKNSALIQIKAAKKELQTTIKSPVFELEVLKYLPKNLADLEFEYICSNCKHIYPIYEERCPNCKELFTLKVEPVISENSIKYRENYN
jgi:lipopolysaccharide biosynthesis regulator YciM